jgi:uncharacterized integral membrane protein
MKRLKLIATGLAALLAVIIILQNTQSVETRILFAKVAMPRAVLLITTTAIGFLLGLAFGSFRRLRGSADAEES